MGELRETLFYCLAGMMALSASAQVAATEEETAEQRIQREALQMKWAQLPAVEVGTSLKDVTFRTVALDKAKVQAGKDVYYAMRFRAPESVGDLLWAWRPWADQRVNWGLVPAQGSTGPGFSEVETKHLRKDVKDAGSKGTGFILQWLDLAQLTPGGDYILWFKFEKVGPFTKPSIVCSLNVLPGGADMRWKDVFPMFFE